MPMQRALDRISPDIIIHGADQAGADSMAGRYESVNQSRNFPAEWRKYGRSAGYRRNQQMLDEGNPDLVVAFPGGPGTQNMVIRTAAGSSRSTSSTTGEIPSTGKMPP